MKGRNWGDAISHVVVMGVWPLVSWPVGCHDNVYQQENLALGRTKGRRGPGLANRIPKCGPLCRLPRLAKQLALWENLSRDRPARGGGYVNNIEPSRAESPAKEH